MPSSDFRYTFADVEVRSALEVPELQPIAGDAASRADIISLCWRAWPAHAVTWFHWWGEPAAPWARFGETPHGYLVEFPDVATFRIDRRGRQIDVAPAAGVPPFTVRHLLLNQVLPLALSRVGRLVLHAGAVAVDGRAVLFAGPTGAGKSTLVGACADRGAEVVADDSVVLRRTGGGWMAVPSYPAIRLWDSAMDLIGWSGRTSGSAAHYTDKRRVGPDTGGWRFADGPRPVSRILVLTADGDAARPVAVELYSQIFRLDVRDPAEAVAIFHLVADLARDVPIVRLQPVEDRYAPRVAAEVCEGRPVAGVPGLGA